MMDYKKVNQKEYPEINIYWKDKKSDAPAYSLAYKQLRNGQVDVCSEKMVGIVTISDSKFVIPIVADDNAMEQANFGLASFCYITDAYLPAIFCDEEYYRNYKNSDDFLCTLFHEIGHYYLRHMKKTESHDEEILARNEAMEKGEVYWIELEADRFACHYQGADIMLKHMQTLKEWAVRLGISESGYIEVINREAAIQSLKSDENK